MSNREERLPTRGAFCKSCGRPPHTCGCSKRDMRTLDDWDASIPETKAAKVEKAVNDRAPITGQSSVIGPNDLKPNACVIDLGQGVRVVQTHAGGSIASYGSQVPTGLLSSAAAINSAAQIERAIAHVHSLARHLLNLEDRQLELLKVGVVPLRDGAFAAVVDYDGFSMRHEGRDLDAALNALLADLINRVGERVARGDELIAEVQGQ